MNTESTVRMQCPNCRAIAKGKPQLFQKPVTCPKCKNTGMFVAAQEKAAELADDAQNSEPVATAIPMPEVEDEGEILAPPSEQVLDAANQTIKQLGIDANAVRSPRNHSALSRCY